MDFVKILLLISVGVQVAFTVPFKGCVKKTGNFFVSDTENPCIYYWCENGVFLQWTFPCSYGSAVPYEYYGPIAPCLDVGRSCYGGDPKEARVEAPPIEPKRFLQTTSPTLTERSKLMPENDLSRFFTFSRPIFSTTRRFRTTTQMPTTTTRPPATHRRPIRTTTTMMPTTTTPIPTTSTTPYRYRTTTFVPTTSTTQFQTTTSAASPDKEDPDFGIESPEDKPKVESAGRVVEQDKANGSIRGTTTQAPETTTMYDMEDPLRHGGHVIAKLKHGYHMLGGELKGNFSFQIGLTHITLEITMASMCYLACDLHPGCAGFDWNMDSDSCWFHSSETECSQEVVASEENVVHHTLEGCDDDGSGDNKISTTEESFVTANHFVSAADERKLGPNDIDNSMNEPKFEAAQTEMKEEEKPDDMEENPKDAPESTKENEDEVPFERDDVREYDLVMEHAGNGGEEESMETGRVDLVMEAQVGV